METWRVRNTNVRVQNINRIKTLYRGIRKMRYIGRSETLSNGIDYVLYDTDGNVIDIYEMIRPTQQIKLEELLDNSNEYWMNIFDHVLQYQHPDGGSYIPKLRELSRNEADRIINYLEKGEYHE